MNNNDNMNFNESMKAIRNVILTGDANTDFALSSTQQDKNADMKNALKKKKLSTVLFVIWAFIICFLVAIENILLLVAGSANYFVVVVTVLVGMIGFFIIGRNWSTLNHTAKSKYDQDIMVKAVHEVLPGAICEPNRFINANQLYFMGVVPAFTKASGSYLIQYNKNGHMCFFSNLSLEYRFRREGEKDRFITVFTGQAYILNYKSNLNGCVRIIASVKDPTGHEHINGYRGIQNKEEHRIETENVVFNDNFEVFATDEHSAFYVLSPYVMEQLLLMKQHYGRFGVAVSANEIAIALNTGYYLFEMPSDYKEIDKISIENSKKKLYEFLQLAQGIEDSINGRIRGAE